MPLNGNKDFDFDEEPTQPDEPIEGIAGDRRSDRRYELRLELRWKLIRRRKVLESGQGKTLDLSSGGILFDAGRPLPLGLNVELAVLWPVLLHNVAPLQLVISGRITRSEGQQVAVTISQHEFRTVAAVSDSRPLLPASRIPGALTSANAAAGLKIQ